MWSGDDYHSTFLQKNEHIFPTFLHFYEDKIGGLLHFYEDKTRFLGGTDKNLSPFFSIFPIFDYLCQSKVNDYAQVK